jgi:outer membrane protein assembly factor BamB
MPTPLVLDDMVYACSGGGGFTSSAVACGTRIWWVAEDGEVVCVRPGREFEVLARSTLEENRLATPAISQGVLYLRGRHHLFAVGEPNQD